MTFNNKNNNKTNKTNNNNNHTNNLNHSFPHIILHSFNSKTTFYNHTKYLYKTAFILHLLVQNPIKL